jgi:hypothetical protein
MKGLKYISLEAWQTMLVSTLHLYELLILETHVQCKLLYQGRSQEFKDGADWDNRNSSIKV